MIPKIIWQTHQKPYIDLPEYMTDCSDTWKNFNPDFEYRYLSEDELDDFIIQHFGQEWIDLLNSCPIKIMKIDTWKYMILYIYGGVYADMDYICKAPIQSWSDKEQSMIIFQDDDFLDFSQSVLASEPKSPVLEKVIDSIKHDLLNTKYDEKELVGRLTGYKQFSLAIEKVLDLNNLRKTQSLESYKEFNDLDIVKNMKIYTPFFENWNRYNPDNKLFYTVHGRINWKNNYGNWVNQQIKFQIDRKKTKE
jgi:Glycosyltransferase sugar-binding region containing DXD motif